MAEDDKKVPETVQGDTPAVTPEKTTIEPGAAWEAIRKMGGQIWQTPPSPTRPSREETLAEIDRFVVETTAKLDADGTTLGDRPAKRGQSTPAVALPLEGETPNEFLASQAEALATRIRLSGPVGPQGQPWEPEDLRKQRYREDFEDAFKDWKESLDLGTSPAENRFQARRATRTPEDAAKLEELLKDPVGGPDWAAELERIRKSGTSATTKDSNWLSVGDGDGNEPSPQSYKNPLSDRPLKRGAADKIKEILNDGPKSAADIVEEGPQSGRGGRGRGGDE